MQIKLFTIPITDSGFDLAEMNRFLAAHKVLEVEQRFFQNEHGAHWSFCIRHLANTQNLFSATYSKQGKVDYRTVLSESHFTLFSRLRTIRKQLALNDAVPAYAVFTDEELAAIASLPHLELNSLQQVKGIGEKKVEKYGKQLIELLQEKTIDHETEK